MRSFHRLGDGVADTLQGMWAANASVDGAFVGDSEILILSKDGSEVLHVNAGPLLYVQLPAGKYTLNAIRGDEKKVHTFTIGTKKQSVANVVLSWKVATESAN